MRGMFAAIAAALTMFLPVAPASAEEPGCERVPIFGLNPQIREICDGPIQPDGWWARARKFSQLDSVRSSCDGNYYQGGQCPPWLARDVVPGGEGPVETYIVTNDTIPPGEPGHLG